MIADNRITVGIKPGGVAEVLYIGTDAQKADAAFNAAGPEFVEVGVINHPSPVFSRHPAEEKQQAADSFRAAADREIAAQNKNKAVAAQKLADAARLTAEAKALNPDTDSKTAPKAK